ncbi:MAG: hypothetical protein AB7P99_12710 [Vicinamibacterales bacterium]|uniref:hypothetical protein n=1 Tax=Ramlibacter sp. TaxID=1917967 RepID=UPI003D0B20A3
MPTSLQIERWGPSLLACAVTAAWWWFDGAITITFAKELLGALIGAASIAAGFLATSLSILLPIASTSTGSKLRRSGYRALLFEYMRSAIFSCLLLAVVAVVSFFSLDEHRVGSGVAALLIYNATFAAAALARVTEILMGLFERGSEPDDKGG